ncbi:MAG: type IV toxin-antitoxin system AbiEi family antitoxin [Opitutaceae bacterium]
MPGDNPAILCMEYKNELRPSAFPALVARKFTPPPGQPSTVVRVLALPHVSPRIAGLCAEHGWSWLDLAGNCKIDVPGILHISSTGRAPVHTPPRPAANLGTAEAARVVRALLATDYAGRNWTQRDIQAHCEPGVSLGLVNKVVRHLRDEAFLEDTSEGFRVADPQKLLFTWRDAYRFDRHDRRSYFTLLSGAKLRDALWNFGDGADGPAAYASFSAAEFQAPHVRQPKTWLYLSPKDLPRFVAFTDAKPVDSGDNVVVLLPADDGVFYLGSDKSVSGDRLPCTHPVQTYVDLWHSGGRGQEAAEALLEQYLQPAWKRGEVQP